MTTISAQTILRSRHSQRPDKVLSTLLLRYPRWIHAELMTHRALSRNAASSRAIPVAKLIQDVIDNPAMPIHWGKNQKGMQASEECNERVLMPGLNPGNRRSYYTREDAWLRIRDVSVNIARAIGEAGYHKQIVNRILEPYAHITVLVSATEWTNFLALRDHPDAEPHIAMLAQEIRKELNREDNIQALEPGEWHMPFITGDDVRAALTAVHAGSPHTTTDSQFENADNLLIKLSVARCASTSYKTVDGFDMTLEKAIEIHDKLVGSSPIHASPAEHVAQADDGEMHINPEHDDWAHPGQHGNFVGFRQYRKQLPNESL